MGLESILSGRVYGERERGRVELAVRVQRPDAAGVHIRIARAVAIEEPIDRDIPGRVRVSRLTGHGDEVVHRRPQFDRGDYVMARIVDVC